MDDTSLTRLDSRAAGLPCDLAFGAGLLRTSHRGGFTLIEAMIALAVFCIGAIGCVEMVGLFNRMAASNRAAIMAQNLLDAKVNKLLLVNYDTRAGVVPAPCNPSTTPAAGTNVFNGIDVGGPDTFDSNATDGYSNDTADFWGAFAAGSAAPPLSSTVLISDANNNPIVTGTIYRRTTSFESYCGTVEVTYSIVYNIGSKTYVAQQTVFRAPDEQ